jgi:hypothetical protein
MHGEGYLHLATRIGIKNGLCLGRRSGRGLSRCCRDTELPHEHAQACSIAPPRGMRRLRSSRCVDLGVARMMKHRWVKIVRFAMITTPFVLPPMISSSNKNYQSLHYHLSTRD